jgi:hypothetical protein
MVTTEYVLQTLTDVERQLKLLTAATRADEIIGAASNYLLSWPKERIENLQRIDGGWGTFDYQQRPEPIHGVADIARISNSLSRHCRALKDAGIELTPELLELELYFVLAKQVAEKFISGRPHSQPENPYRRENRRRSDLEPALA